MSGKTAKDYAREYTKPELRERLKERIKASGKGGREGQWSARKSQLLVQEYEKQGGGYKGARSASQRHLEKWQREEWQTKSGGTRARHGDTTSRYLPRRAWQQLSDREKAATERRKVRASREGRQFVPNTEAARRAGRSARRDGETKRDLYARAKRLGIRGRSKMSKAELSRALRRAER